MTDIVVHLRNVADKQPLGTGELMRMAADEIEMLRRVLQSAKFEDRPPMTGAAPVPINTGTTVQAKPWCG